MTNTSVPENTQTDLLWGVDAIASYIGRKRSQCYYLIARGRLPVKKLGRRTFTARKSELDKALSQLAAGESHG